MASRTIRFQDGHFHFGRVQLGSHQAKVGDMNLGESIPSKPSDTDSKKEGPFGVIWRVLNFQ